MEVAETTSSVRENATLLRIVGRLDREVVAERWLSLARKLPAEERMPSTLTPASARDLMEAHLDVFTRLLAEDRVLNQHEEEAIRRVASEWVERGVPVEAIANGLLLGATVSLQLAAETAAAEEHGVLVVATERMMGLLGQYAVALAPLRLQGRAQVIHDEERRSRSLFEGLISDAETTREASALAAELGFDIVEEYRPIAAAVPGESPQAQFELAGQYRAKGVLAYSDGVRVLGLAPAWPERDLAGSSGCVCIVGEVTRRGTLGEALADLSLLVDLRCRFGLPGAMALDEFPLERLLLRSPQLATVIERRVLGPLTDAGPDLVETVEAMIRNDMKRAPAARELQVHPGTVDYRIHRVGELTGLVLGRPGDLALVVLALKHRTLTG